MASRAERIPVASITPVVAWMVGVLAGVHFLQWTVVRAEDVQALLAFYRSDIEAGRWWSAATYALVQPSMTMLALNAYALLLFGPRLERFWGAKRFVGFAILSAMGGWIAHQFVGGAAPLLGASAIAFGVIGAYAMRWGGEERPLLGGFVARERWAIAFLSAVMVLSGMQESVGGRLAFLSHLGGFAAAWVFARAARVMLIERFRESVSAMPDEPPEDQPPRAVPKTMPRGRAQKDLVKESLDEAVAKSSVQTPVAPAKKPEENPPTINAILDKISAAGLEGLTVEERRVLDEHSRRLRDR